MNNGINSFPNTFVSSKSLGGFARYEQTVMDLMRGMFNMSGYHLEPVVFRGTSDRFPFGTTPQNTSSNRIFSVFFHVSEVVTTIDFGNGDVWTFTGDFELRSRVSTIPGVDYYVYPDGFIKERFVTITFSAPEKVRRIVSNNNQFTNTLLPTGMVTLKGIQVIDINGIGGLVLDIPDGFLLLEALNNIQFAGIFSTSSRFYANIPLFFFTKPLTVLAYAGAALGSRSFGESNLDKIALLSETLTQLELNSNGLQDDNFGDGSLPSNFSQLVNLKIFYLTGNLYTTPPAVLNSITSIETLYIDGMDSLLSYGDLSALVNLRVLRIVNNGNITTNVPAFFTAFNLKNFSANIAFRTTARLDAHIDSLYNLVIANAPIVGVSTDKLRSVTASYNNISGSASQFPPSGTYQQPAGYVQGVSNGTPVSAKEKIWVLVNQYGWAISTE